MNPSNETKTGLSCLYRGRLLYFIPLFVFAVLAFQVASHQQIAFDEPVMSFFGNLRSISLNLALKQVTELGSSRFIVAAVLVISGALIAKRRYRFAMFLPAAVVGAGILDGLLKNLFQSPRPTYLSHLVVENGFGFPSGHSMASSAFALALIYILWNTRWRRISLSVGVVYIMAIGISRIYLGVHFPSDVLGGWCVSLLWVGLLAHLMLGNSARSSAKSRI